MHLLDKLVVQYGKLLAQKSNWQESIQQLQYGLNLIAQSPDQVSLALESYLLIGDIFLKQDNLEAAISSYQQAIVIDPKSAKAHWQLAQFNHSVKKAGSCIPKFCFNSFSVTSFTAIA